MSPIERTARVLKIVVPIASPIGATAWLFPNTFERFFGYGGLVIAQFVGLPTVWLIGAAANVVVIAGIIGAMVAIALAFKWLLRLK